MEECLTICPCWLALTMFRFVRLCLGIVNVGRSLVLMLSYMRTSLLASMPSMILMGLAGEAVTTRPGILGIWVRGASGAADVDG